MFGVIPAFWQRRVTGGGSGELKIFFGVNSVPAGGVSGDPVTQRDLFLAECSTMEIENWESYEVAVDVGGPQPLNGVVRTRNSIAATFTVADTVVGKITNNTALGRFNTTPIPLPPPDELPCWAEGFTPITITFATPIAIFGFFGTDFGDFAFNVQITLTRVDTTTLTLNITPPGQTNANLIFWGMVDSTGTLYTKAEITADSGGDPNLQDVFGIDDIYWADASYILP